MINIKTIVCLLIKTSTVFFSQNIITNILIILATQRLFSILRADYFLYNFLFYYFYSTLIFSFEFTCGSC